MSIEEIVKVLEEYPATIAAIATGIAALTAVIALWANLQSRKQYNDSIQPQLSMTLMEFGYRLYLEIRNTGGMPAKNIRVSVNRIRNNGERNVLELDPLFAMPFELYPGEKVQGAVATFGADITNHPFPQIDINVKYSFKGRVRKVKYSRSVTYVGACGERIYADVNFDAREQNQSLRTTARAAVRIANYLDGRQVASFDELEILAHRSLKNDLRSLCCDQDKDIVPRYDTIQTSLGCSQPINSRDQNSKSTKVKYRIKRKQNDQH